MIVLYTIDGGVSKPSSLTALHSGEWMEREGEQWLMVAVLLSSDTLAVRERQHEATRLRASRVANIDVMDCTRERKRESEREREGGSEASIEC